MGGLPKSSVNNTPEQPQVLWILLKASRYLELRPQAASSPAAWVPPHQPAWSLGGRARALPPIPDLEAEPGPEPIPRTAMHPLLSIPTPHLYSAPRTLLILALTELLLYTGHRATRLACLQLPLHGDPLRASLCSSAKWNWSCTQNPGSHRRFGIRKFLDRRTVA